MCKSERSIETMAEEIRSGNYADFGKLLHLCTYIPKETFEKALKLGYEKEDIYQESVIAFIHALHSFDKNRAAGFRTYASVCIKNHIVSLLRSGQRAKNSALVDYVSIDEIDIEAKNQPETDWIEKEAFFDIKKQIIKVLSGFELEVLRLYLYGSSYKDIAEKLEKSEKSVSNALSRVRKKLRAAIGPEQ